MALAVLEPPSQLRLQDYLRVIRRRRRVIGLATAVVVVTALASSLIQRPVYRAVTEILVRPDTRESLFDPESGQRTDPGRALQTEIRVLKSAPVRQAVKDKLGVAPGVSVRPFGQTDVIRVEADSTNGARAAAVANAYATAYIDFRRTQAVDELVAAGRELQIKITDLQRRINSLDPKGEAAQRDSLVQQQALLRQKVDQLDVDSAIKTGGARVVTPAVAPTSPVKPTPIRSAVLALAAGLILGFGVAFLFEFLDESIKSRDDVERVMPGVPLLGLIPRVPGWKDAGKPYLASAIDPKSSTSEAYRSLRTSIQFIGLDHPLRTIQVTSGSAGEGKTTTLANLGITLAQSGQRVVIVSCDLRRPRIHEFFGATNDVGFTSVLLGEVPLSDAIQSLPQHDGLALLASGPTPPNPSELLASRRTAEVLASLQASADVLLLDCPPLLPVTDAAVLSSRVDATLLVVTVGSTTRRELQHAYELLRQVDAPVIGTILNAVTGDGTYYGYSYRYQYDYAEPAPSHVQGSNGVRRNGVRRWVASKS